MASRGRSPPGTAGSARETVCTAERRNIASAATLTAPLFSSSPPAQPAIEPSMLGAAPPPPPPPLPPPPPPPPPAALGGTTARYYWSGFKLYAATLTLHAAAQLPGAPAAAGAPALQAEGEALLRDWGALSDAARGVFEAKARYLDVCAALAEVRAKIGALESGAVLGTRRKRALVLAPRQDTLES